MKPFYFDLDKGSLPRGNHFIGSANLKSITSTFVQELSPPGSSRHARIFLPNLSPVSPACQHDCRTHTNPEFKNNTYHSNNCLEHQKSVKKLCSKYFTAPENSAQVTRYREPRQQLILAGLTARELQCYCGVHPGTGPALDLWKWITYQK